MDLLLLFALSVAPGAAIALYIYLKDKHEREPLGLLARSFFFGGISIVITVLLGYTVDQFITINENDISEQAFHAFLIVALIEELSKFIFVRGVLYNDRNFNEPFDGIVYSVMVGMGFATFENIIYVFQNGFETAILRMFTAVPAHAMFAILMGYYLGKAKFEHNKRHYAIYGLAVATFFHGAYDYCLFIKFVPGLWLGAIVSLVVGIVLARKAIRIHQHASPFKPEEVTVKNEARETADGTNNRLT